MGILVAALLTASPAGLTDPPAPAPRWPGPVLIAAGGAAMVLGGLAAFVSIYVGVMCRPDCGAPYRIGGGITAAAGAAVLLTGIAWLIWTGDG